MESEFILQAMNLTTNQIPPSIDTVEKLAAWAALLLHRANGTLKVIESPGFSDFACQASIFQADDGTQRLVVRLNLQLTDSYAEADAKLWTQITPFSNVAVPTAYLS